MKKIFQDLLEKYHTGECTEDELRQLMDLLEEDPSLYKYLDQHVDREWELQMIRKDVKDEDPEEVRKRSSGKKWIWAAAAGLILLIAAGGAGLWWNSDAGFTIYSTDFGERKEIELPDGSQVELNANTRLTWDNNWLKTGVREVTLEGEAFFEVVKSGAPQFKVISDEISVNVLGTSFNVSNRRGKTEVFLEKGAVTLELSEVNEIIDMKPGEKIWYDRSVEESIHKLVDETLYSAAAWKMGVISYQKTPLKKILPELSDIYGIRIECEDTLLQEKVMDIGVPYMDWEATKNSLELAMKVRIEEEAGVYLIKENNNK